MEPNGVHIPRVPSKEEIMEIEKMVAEGRSAEAAQKFGGQVIYPQEPTPMADAELVVHLRGGLVPVSVAYRAAARIEQLEAALTRANAATAAAYEVAARAAHKEAWPEDGTYGPEEREIEDAERATVTVITAAIRALATPDQTAALDELIAEAEARGMKRAAEIADAKYAAGEMGNPGHHILAASKKGGV